MTPLPHKSSGWNPGNTLFLFGIRDQSLWSVLGRAAAQAACRQVRVELLDAIRAYAVGEGGIGVFLDVALHLAPIALVVADFLATGADGQQPAQRLHVARASCKSLMSVSRSASVCFRAVMSSLTAT